jgi:hypothetical protein
MSVLDSFDRRSFHDNLPYPWAAFSGLLPDAIFDRLVGEFPPLAFFERHEGMPRPHGQRPHDRYYLALGESIYGARKAGQPGLIQADQVSPAWRAFVDALRDDPYLDFIRELLGHGGNMDVRFAWHTAGRGDDVSPHLDSEHKIGTHIFYFTATDDWSDSWGGHTVFLDGKRHRGLNPEFDDFKIKARVEMRDNCSMLFKNTSATWHGVERISCPPGRFRQTFNVIFERPGSKPRLRGSISRIAGLRFQSW